MILVNQNKALTDKRFYNDAAVSKDGRNRLLVTVRKAGQWMRLIWEREANGFHDTVTVKACGNVDGGTGEAHEVVVSWYAHSPDSEIESIWYWLETLAMQQCEKEKERRDNELRDRFMSIVTMHYLECENSKKENPL